MTRTIEELIPEYLRELPVYIPGRPIEEVEEELKIHAIKLASNENPLGPLTLEGLPQGRYRLLEEKEVEGLRRAMSARRAENRKWKVEKGKAPRMAVRREKAKN